MASYELLGFATVLSQGCMENCITGDLISIEGLPVKAKLECCSENYCNKSNNIISQFKKVSIIFISVFIALLNV